ncbi:unnamed protein product [Allacma fusca]|uniref:MYND-type domain-containing protein n=1 Tax=Allacma fusca TaxID=39272 RepID=A0A8J2LF27_9HEXA|nr:unnamed protein product [Allacma fusca]
MTKESKLKKKKEEIVAPEIPAISLHCGLPKESSTQEVHDNDAMTDASQKKDQLRSKLFKSSRIGKNENEKNQASKTIRDEETWKNRQEFKKTNLEEKSNSGNTIKVTSVNGGNTYLIDSTNGSSDPSYRNPVIYDQLREKRSDTFLSYDLFQQTLQEEITNRENAKTFTFNSFPGTPSEEASPTRRTCVQNINEDRQIDVKNSPGPVTDWKVSPLDSLKDKIRDLQIHGRSGKACEKAFETEEDQVEEILGLEIEHDNEGKFSSNPMVPGQRYQLYPDPSKFMNTSYSNNSTGVPVSTSKVAESTQAGGSPARAGSVPGLYNLQNRDNKISGTSNLAPCSSIWDGINQLCEVQTCSQPASKKCKNCKAAYYCSEEHQKWDWKSHKHNCIPYKMEIIDDTRRAMVAVRNIPAGRVIFQEKPFLVFPIASFETDFVHVMELNCVILAEFLHTCGAKKPACLGCMKPMELTGNLRHHCSKCGLPLCSKSCEYEIAHQLGECAVISNAGGLSKEERPPSCFHSLYMDVEILRALQLEQFDPPQWEKFLELRQHVRVELYKRTPRFDLFVRNTKRLVPYSAKASGYNFDLISDVHAIITALSFKPSLKSPYKMLISTQLYFAHNCVPNTLQYVEHQVTGAVHKMRCVVKAAVTIFKGEFITLDFVPTPYLAYSLRRRVLENMSLNCACTRCDNPSKVGDHSGDIICPNCRRGLVRPETAVQWKDSVWSCDRCQEEVPYAQIIESYKELRTQLCNIPKNRESLEKLYQFIQRAQDQLNPTHELVIMAWCFIETIIRPNLDAVRFPDPFKVLPESAIQDYVLLAQYCKTCEKHFKALRPGFWLDLGVVQFQKFYANFAISAREFQENRLPRKEFIIRVLRAMKYLQEAVVILGAYDGYNATESVSRLTQDATWTLTTIKSVVDKLFKEEQAVRSRHLPDNS